MSAAPMQCSNPCYYSQTNLTCCIVCCRHEGYSRARHSGTGYGPRCSCCSRHVQDVLSIVYTPMARPANRLPRFYALEFDMSLSFSYMLQGMQHATWVRARYSPWGHSQHCLCGHVVHDRSSCFCNPLIILTVFWPVHILCGTCSVYVFSATVTLMLAQACGKPRTGYQLAALCSLILCTVAARAATSLPPYCLPASGELTVCEL